MRNCNRHSTQLVFLFTVWILQVGRANAAIEIAKGDSSAVSIFGTAQLLALGEDVQDYAKKDARAYLFMQQSRLGFLGHLA